MIELFESPLSWGEKRRKFNELTKDLTPEEKLECYSVFLSKLAPQGTEQWKAERKIGGSIAHKILTKPAEAHKLITGKKKFAGNLDTQWGNMMEVVAMKYFEPLKIYHFGSIPGFGFVGEEVITSYSPDGIFVGNEKFGVPGKICLLEIKCPSKRASGEGVPECYVPQIQMGLASTICELCVYSEFYIKACSVADFNFGRDYSASFSKYRVKNNPIAIGFVSFSGEFASADPIAMKNWMPSHTQKLLESRMPKFDGIDFGSTVNIFYKSGILNKYEYDRKYSELLFNGDPIEFFEREWTRLGGAGVLCYKIFEVKIINVDKVDFRKEITQIVKFASDIFSATAKN